MVIGATTVSRDDRQAISGEKYEKAGAKGTLVAPTSYGKTRVALNAIRRLRRTKPYREVIIVVPTLQLQAQWLTILFDQKLLEFTKVMVINTAIKEKRSCSLLVIDEIHRTGAESFSKIFEMISYSFILGLTATLERIDKRHVLIKSYCPIFDKITVTEARANGWMSPYTEYNLGIELGAVEMDEYKKLEEAWDKSMTYFMGDFGVMKKCAASYRPVVVRNDEEGRRLTSPLYFNSECSNLAISYKWKGKTPYSAHQSFEKKETNEWGGDVTNPYHPHMIYVMAINGMRTMHKIKSFVYSNPHKVNAALEIIKRFPTKTLTFAALTETADTMTEAINSSGWGIPTAAISYHSNVKGTVDPTTGKKISGKKTREHLLSQFLNDPTCLVANTAKSLDEGFDSPEAQLGIIIDRTTTPRQQIQRRGRVTRVHTFPDGTTKHATLVNVYLKGTKDEVWLKKAQDSDPYVIWVNQIEEMDFNNKKEDE